MSTAQGVGQILAIHGAEAVLVRCIEDQLKSLEVGDWLQPGDTILAPPQVSLDLVGVDGQTVALPPGQDTKILAELFESLPPGAQEPLAADESVDALIESILAGDDFEEQLDATAAGPAGAGGGDGEGSSFIRLTRISEGVDPTDLNSPQVNNVSFKREGNDDGTQLPEATDDAVTVPEDEVASIDVLRNDTAADGGPLSVADFDQPAHGSVTQDPATGLLVYTPDAHYNGSDSFDYTVIDASGNTSAATVSINVLPVNDPPLAQPDAATTPQDTAVTVDVLNNDSDIDGDTLTVTAIHGEAVAPGESVEVDHGTATLNADGSITYSPGPEYNGTDQFSYTISDGQGGSDSSTVDINVIPEDDPPPVVEPDNSTDALDDAFVTDEDVALNIGRDDLLGNDLDAEGDPLTITGFTQPEHGSVTDNGQGGLTYTPDADYNGADSFTYSISDGQGASDTATVSLQVNPVNDPPVAADDAATTAEDVAVDINVLANDSDIDGDLLTVDSFSQPANGVVTQNIDGTLRYSPAAGYSGSDSFSYTVSDGAGGTDTATVNLTVTPDGGPPVINNRPPVAGDDTASTSEDLGIDIDVLANDSDIDGDTLSIAGFTQPANGTVTPNANGTLHYAPDPDYNGADSFSYTVSDGAGGTDTATVNLTVTPDNDPPIAVDDAYSTSEDVTLSVDGNVLDSLLANDSDLDGDSLSVNTTPVTDVSNGALTLNADGSFSYVPDANFNGSDDFVYEVSDGAGGTDTATVTITIGDVNDPPTAGDDSATTQEETAVTVDVTGNDADIDGSIVGWTVDSGPAQGSLVNHGDGTFTYTPGDDYSGSDSFTYHVTDDDGAISNVATVNLSVEAGNNAPVVATAETNSVTESDLVDTTDDVEASGTVSASDADGDALSYTLNAPSLVLTSGGNTVSWSGSGTGTLTGTAGGATVATLSITSAGAYIFTLLAPLDHPDGTVEDILTLDFGVTVSDGSLSDSTTLNINVVDDSPVVNASEDVLLSYTIGDGMSGDLDIAFGADGPADPGAVELNLSHGQMATYTNTADGSTGQLSSNGTPLNWYQDSNGDWYAATAEGGSHILEVTLGQDNYTVSVTGELDGASHTQVVPLNGGNEDLRGGHQDSATVDLDFNGDGSFDAYLHLTATDEATGSDVNWNNNWLGVEDATTIDVDETFTIAFRDYGSGAHSGTESLIPFTQMNVDLARFTGSDAGTWTASLDGAQVASGAFNTSSAADGSISIAPGLEFDTVTFTATEGDYGIATLQLSSQQFIDGIDQRIDFGFTAADSDGDSDSGGFSATLVAAEEAGTKLLNLATTDSPQEGLDLLQSDTFSWTLAGTGAQSDAAADSLTIFSGKDSTLDLGDVLHDASAASLLTDLHLSLGKTTVVSAPDVSTAAYDADLPSLHGDLDPTLLASLDSGLQLVQDLLNKASLSPD